MAAGEVPLESNKLIRWVVTSHAKYVAGGSLLMMSHQTCEALVPVVIGLTIDRAVASGRISELVPMILLLAGVFLVLANSWRFGARLLRRAAKGAEHELRMAVTRRVLRPDGGAESGRLTGELLNIATGDAERVGRLPNVMASAAGAIAALAVTTVVLLTISIPLGLIIVAGSIPLIFAIQYLGRILERHTGVEQANAARAAGLANDLVSGLRVLKGIGAEKAAADLYTGASQDSLRATIRASNTQAMFHGVTLALTGAFIAPVAYVGGHLAADGTISIGDFIAALGLTQFIIEPMGRFTMIGANLARVRASAARIARVLATPPAAANGAASLRAAAEGQLEVSGLSYGTLQDFSLTLKAGEFVGLVTSNPADAMALLEVATRGADPVAGTISVDGVDFCDLPAETVHTAVLAPPHDTYLFARTLRENVLAATESEARLNEAISASASDEVAENLPIGLETMLSEGGRSLSGGQRQRVGLARALAADSPVLILHDPTTAVDSVTESRIAAGLRQMRRGRTTLLVTTSPALLAVTDRIVVLREGHVASSGEHDDLVASDAAYREAVLA